MGSIDLDERRKRSRNIGEDNDGMFQVWLRRVCVKDRIHVVGECPLYEGGKVL